MTNQRTDPFRMTRRTAGQRRAGRFRGRHHAARLEAHGRLDGLFGFEREAA
jgi:hypothetical protein